MLEVRDELAVTAPLADAPEWTSEAAWSLYRQPFNDLLFRAQTVHRQNFDPNRVQLSRLLSIKTGGCPEDCGYCSQSAHHSTGLAGLEADGGQEVVAEATQSASRRRHPLLHGRGLAQSEGARHGCGGGDGRRREGARARDLHDARHAGPRTGAPPQAAGLDYYNHNIDTSERYYPRDHQHAQLCRSARYARECPPIRHQGLLRRHCRHGRRAEADRSTCWSRWPTSRAAGKRSDQHADSDRRHPACRSQARSSRSNLSA